MKNETFQHALAVALEMAEDTKHRAQVHLDKYDNIKLLTVTIHKRTASFWFLDDVRVYSYWLTQSQRAPMVKKLHYEGMTNKRIGEFLGFHATTIGKDLKLMRENGELDAAKRLTKADIMDTLKLRDSSTSVVRDVKKVTDLRDFAFGKTFRAA